MARPTKGSAACGLMFMAWLGATRASESPTAPHSPMVRVMWVVPDPSPRTTGAGPSRSAVPPLPVVVIGCSPPLASSASPFPGGNLSMRRVPAR